MAARTQSKQPEMVDLTGPSAPFGSPAGAAGGRRVFVPGTVAPSAFTPLSGAKKLVIKNLRVPAKRNDDTQSYYTKTWADIESALADVFGNKTPRQPLERLYRGVEDLCIQGQSEQLCKKLQTLCEAHMTNTVLKRIEANTRGVSNIDVLREVHKEWLVWGKQLVIIRSTFSYLDRAYLIGARSLPNVNDMLISRFRRTIFDTFDTPPGTPPRLYSALGLKVLTGMCDLTEQDRLGDPAFDASLFRESISMVHVFTIYVSYFEPLFLEKSTTYLQDTAREAESIADLRNYIQAAESLLRREVTRCNAFNFDSSTKSLLLKAAQHELIVARQHKLLDQTSVAKLLDDNDSASMKALYDLQRMATLHKKLLVPWGQYIEHTGSGIVMDVKRGDEMVVRLLLLRRNLDVMVRDAFSRDENFTYAMREAFGHFINDDKVTSAWASSASKVGEMIAKYIDMLLRGGLKTLPPSLLSDRKDRADAERSGQASTGDEDAELDRQLDQGIELFRFIHGKDVFEAFYKRDLARRLLMGRSASQDAERNMLGKLKTECGSSLTHNLEQMFRDQELSRDEMASYKQWVDGTGHKNSASDSDEDEKRRAALRVELQVSVLSAAAWPTYTETKLCLPPDVLYQIDMFDSYYKNKHSGRKLTWMHSLGHCVVSARFNKGVKELLVSSYQAAVLVLFNDVDAAEADKQVLSYKQLSQATGLEDSDLNRTLQSLACGKVRVLSKHPRGRDVNDTDTFTVNKAFTDPKFRIKINQIQHKETKAENTATYERVAADRQFETQAAIVRIMKSRKTLPHAQLVAEVINQTKSRGALDPAEIKQNIEK